MRALRFWTVCLLLLGAALVLHLRGSSETRVMSDPLSQFPWNLDAWHGTDQPLDSETIEVLGPGDFLSRVYSRGNAEPVSLFIGYFPSQRTGVTIHSPKNCLPGAGWAFDSSKTVTLEDVGGKPHRVGEYIISNGDRKQFVIYWYEAHGRIVANEYLAKMFLVTDAIRMNRTDGALVRVVTPVFGVNDVPTARSRAEQFVAHLIPTLPQFIPN